ncbi:MAG: glycosyltransferase family 39 protein, partial [Candidatus Mariimomonas ferrooxydans]
MKEMPYRISIVCFIILSVAAMVIFSSYGINRSIWLDEAIGPLFSSGSVDFIIENLRTDNHPPLYSFLLAVWMKVFGQSEAALRSLSGLFYFLSVFSVYFIVRELYDQKAGLICALLFLLSPLAIKHAQNVRSYTLLALFSILSSGYFFKTFIQQKCSARNVAIYVLFNIFGTFTHYCFAFVLISHFVSFVCHYYSWKFIKTFLKATPHYLNHHS